MQYRFLYDIQQRNIDDHSNVILSLMARSLLDGATSSLTLAIGPATRTRAGVLTAEDCSMEIELPLADYRKTSKYWYDHPQARRQG